MINCTLFSIGLVGTIAPKAFLATAVPPASRTVEEVIWYIMMLRLRPLDFSLRIRTTLFKIKAIAIT